MKILFDDSAREFVLDAFGKSVRDGFIVEKSEPTTRVVTPRGEEISIEQFAGIRKGSVVCVKSDIVSLIEAAQALRS